MDFDPDSGIPAGRSWERELYAQLRRADGVLYVASPAANASRWCFAELSLARSIAAMERWAEAPKSYPQRHLPVPELDRINPDTWEPWLCHPQLDPTGGLLNRYERARELLRH